MLSNLNAGPRRKSCQTILYLKMEIKPFSLFSGFSNMFFRSRVDASHTRVIGHAVYRQHVRRGPCIDVVSIGKTTQIVEAGDHLVLQSFVDHILPPEIPHSVLDPLKIRDRNAARVGQNVRYYEDSLLVKYLVR